jgi:segregation and condensation protein B
METLAVIAYRQPALRADIEAIRGVNCGEILRQLMERDLVRIGGRSEELGRPYLYATTKNFLRLFGLDALDSLPRVETIATTEQEAVVLSTESAVVNETIDGIDKVPNEEESGMPVLTLSGLELDEPRDAASKEERVKPDMASVDDDQSDGEDVDDYDDVDLDDDDDDDEFDDDDDDDDDDEADLDDDVEVDDDVDLDDDVDVDDDVDLDDDDDDEDDDDFEDELEEVEDEDDDDWDDDDDETDWGYEDDEDEDDDDDDDEWD